MKTKILTSDKLEQLRQIKQRLDELQKINEEEILLLKNIKTKMIV